MCCEPTLLFSEVDLILTAVEALTAFLSVICDPIQLTKITEVLCLPHQLRSKQRTNAYGEMCKDISLCSEQLIMQTAY